jgi:FtsH-binding integral membrane protein
MLGARLTAATAGIMNVTVGALYLPSMPEELVRRPLQPGQVSAVVYIEHIGPLWSVMFIITGVVLIMAAMRRRGFIPAHLGAVFVWAFYGAAILFSAFLTQPPVPVVAGAIASFTALVHLAVARGCAERGMR